MVRLLVEKTRHSLLAPSGTQCRARWSLCAFYLSRTRLPAKRVRSDLVQVIQKLGEDGRGVQLGSRVPLGTRVSVALPMTILRG